MDQVPLGPFIAISCGLNNGQVKIGIFRNIVVIFLNMSQGITIAIRTQLIQLIVRVNVDSLK